MGPLRRLGRRRRCIPLLPGPTLQPKTEEKEITEEGPRGGRGAARGGGGRLRLRLRRRRRRHLWSTTAAAGEAKNVFFSLPSFPPRPPPPRSLLLFLLSQSFSHMPNLLRVVAPQAGLQKQQQRPLPSLSPPPLLPSPLHAESSSSPSPAIERGGGPTRGRRGG